MASLSAPRLGAGCAGSRSAPDAASGEPAASTGPTPGCCSIENIGLAVEARGSRANASLTVPYTVEWSGTSGQTSGTALSAGSSLTGLTSAATNSNCASGPSASASLIVKIGATDLQTMDASTSYTGTLTLLVAPE